MFRLKKTEEKVPAKRSNERKHGKQFENNCERVSFLLFSIGTKVCFTDPNDSKFFYSLLLKFYPVFFLEILQPKRANENYNRDRVTKEQNRIILGPQRRSFNSGCFVPVSTTNCATTASSNQNPFNSTTIGIYIPKIISLNFKGWKRIFSETTFYIVFYI